MGIRLLDLKSETKGELNDEKSLRGRNRLTGILMSKIQRYHSRTIKNNINDLLSMKTSVRAVYFHLLSSKTTPLNMDCIQTYKCLVQVSKDRR
ncbi:hypothetical protein TNCV_2206651 [Trichonephila clavipes]|uniref:Uncharacterized protein n=1 Tax=Trichonephila clavipes TaxID=2585209 RepID=A0A8X6S1P5_TRICX|nr:hypothetical protein TNCV_2206651 [Trichonephila clavipes]